MAKKAARPIRAPKPPKQFFSMRQVRVTSTTGHTAIIEANKPKLLPEVLWMDAISKGCIEFDPKLIKAAARAADLAGKSPSNQVTKPRSAREQVAAAVKQLVLAGDKATLTKDGVPKVPAVRQVVGNNPQVKITSELVYDVYLELADEGAFGTAEEPEETIEELEKRVDASGLDDPDGMLEPVGGGVAAAIESAAGADGELESQE